MADPVDEFVRRFGLAEGARIELLRLLGQVHGPTAVPDDADPNSTLMLDDDDEPAAEAPEALGRKYQDLGPLGVGGMSEVRRVRDLELGRVLAMKIADPTRARSPKVIARFVEEAQTTAQLDHPGVIPVHELGRTSDGRLFFTMKEVRGRTLREVIRAVHDASPSGTWAETPDGWTLHRLLDTYRRVCETVAHAHARGVVHRDLKPDNVMVGAYGEVLVLDWGLARSTGRATEDEGLEPIRTDRGRDASLRTRVGTVAGTPMYMSPEQARGELDRLDARSDVYALGVLLYEILYGWPPYPGAPIDAVLERIVTSRLEEPRTERPVPEDLVALWRACTAPDRDQRPADAGVPADRIRRWQEGAERRERALAVVAEANRLLPEVARLRERAEAWRLESARLMDGVEPWDPVERKRAGWELSDEAVHIEERADLEELRATELLRAALTQAPDLPEARARLADLYREHHEAAEERGDRRAAARYEVLLRAHDDGRHAAWLQGDGTLTLLTEPEGAEVEALRYALRDRRLEPEPFRFLGHTPLSDTALPPGSYLLLIRRPGQVEVRYPVRIRRQGRWDGVPPGEGAPAPIHLPALDQLDEDDVYVPPGWFSAGEAPGRPEWVDGFVMRRFPVTNTEYIAFLDDLVARGDEEAALRHAPREVRPGGQPGDLIYGRTADGRFVIQPDAQGDRWEPDWPVLMVDFDDARAYAAWFAARTGRPWRLPWELEWEKAARGVDGRRLPWGDHADPTWARIRTSSPGRMLPASVHDYPTDESPYGVRGLAGNVTTWCLDPASPGSAERAIRGGAWSYAANSLGAPLRGRAEPGRRTGVNGFRLVRSWPG